MAATDPTTRRRWSRWMSAWTALSAPGLCLAVIDWGPGTVAVLSAVLSVPFGLTLILLQHDHEERPTLRAGVRWTSRVVLCAISLFISTAAIAASVPGLALLVVLVAAATTPRLMDLRHRAIETDSTHRPPTPAEATVEEQPSPGRPLGETPRTMTNRQLCQAWRRSYWALKDARDPREKLRLVEQRTRLLDELEARNAAALEAWLASGGRACDGPDKFFDDDDRDQPTAA